VCVLLSAYGSPGGVEPLAGLAVRLRASGAEARVCGPPDKEFTERLAGRADLDAFCARRLHATSEELMT